MLTSSGGRGQLFLWQCEAFQIAEVIYARGSGSITTSVVSSCIATKCGISGVM